MNLRKVPGSLYHTIIQASYVYVHVVLLYVAGDNSNNSATILLRNAGSKPQACLAFMISRGTQKGVAAAGSFAYVCIIL